MSQITVSFKRDWIDNQREKGVRVIRQLEKWVATEEGVTLKSSSGSGFTVELQPAVREKFLDDLAERMKALAASRTHPTPFL